MNKLFFRLLVFLMSISLIGIILVQLYWFKTSFENNDEQFNFHIQKVIADVSHDLDKKELKSFINKYEKLKDSTGKIPEKKDLLQFYYVQKNNVTNETIVYSNSIISENYNLNPSLFNLKKDSLQLLNFSAKRKTEVYSGSVLDNSLTKTNLTPDVTIQKTGSLDLLKNLQFEIAYKDISSVLPIQERISKDKLTEILAQKLQENGVKTHFEFGIYENSKLTEIKSENFKVKENATFSIPIFVDSDGNEKYKLFLSFPNKKKYLFSELAAITLLSIVFTIIIIIAYSSALNQLIKQRQISEIKTDFINNMTHEFKTPIATINLALDAIKSPKVIDNKDTILRYLQMIRDENKRMHAQVENVLRISKLEKKELEINKEPLDIQEIIEDAIDHVHLILEDRGGKIITNFKSTRNVALLNDVHFTNVMVNILDNAIKYSVENPVIHIATENIKDFVIVKIKDNGIGMNKATQKRIFEKFYREHTGDVHNVKGHGLGLAYVKRIVDDHNSQIYVESEKGSGTTFIIKIPLIN
ncbi:two-component sensor histidine kinase [Flavobacterium branchiophilum NBRC 15030 = ATCC 35035]|uniref:histidine kinase n=1 Tax=Flavobacterium branchiophilum TaxID=55197 RepID=A0A543G8H0_9FLAO|nr:HAMP domain-containing sensor histidine kinase [Flavobacterium branchiophilum]OXA68182.1 two-component sensor histidine kinase [Flavobacterium branchiophilum NBRC 15030 = ATCC 35035]TQM42377.1 two-component system phosphate regulon sensor histidine kinase PhoR [Flavobacterium branchiophilum]